MAFSSSKVQRVIGDLQMPSNSFHEVDYYIPARWHDPAYKLDDVDSLFAEKTDVLREAAQTLMYSPEDAERARGVVCPLERERADSANFFERRRYYLSMTEPSWFRMLSYWYKNVQFALFVFFSQDPEAMQQWRTQTLNIMGAPVPDFMHMETLFDTISEAYVTHAWYSTIEQLYMGGKCFIEMLKYIVPRVQNGQQPNSPEPLPLPSTKHYGPELRDGDRGTFAGFPPEIFFMILTYLTQADLRCLMATSAGVYLLVKTACTGKGHPLNTPHGNREEADDFFTSSLGRYAWYHGLSHQKFQPNEATNKRIITNGQHYLITTASFANPTNPTLYTSDRAQRVILTRFRWFFKNHKRFFNHYTKLSLDNIIDMFSIDGYSAFPAMPHPIFKSIVHHICWQVRENANGDGNEERAFEVLSRLFKLRGNKNNNQKSILKYFVGSADYIIKAIMRLSKG